MKTILSFAMALGSLSFISSCTTVEQRDPAVHSSTTTTEQTTVRTPLSNTVETQTTRTY